MSEINNNEHNIGKTLPMDLSRRSMTGNDMQSCGHIELPHESIDAIGRIDWIERGVKRGEDSATNLSRGELSCETTSDIPMQSLGRQLDAMSNPLPLFMLPSLEPVFL